MKIYGKNSRRVLASGLALWMALGLCAPAVSAAGPSPTMDETYYATLDYYGGLMDSSVVKSVRTFGNAAFTDYGTYDEVINLTDDRAGTVSGNQLTFDLTGNVPEKFYFEGKTNQPYEDFPWKLSLDYKLNGLPAKAEKLAGQKGVVEITLNALPRTQGVSEYSRNNLVLTAMSMFNGDDILSLEAPGAQVQLVGNLYCVLYAVLPGEEQHFTIRVGAEEFSYSGMIFLAVPATLDQLSQVADLREAKEKAEDSYHAIQDSLDVLLDSLDGMSGSLNTTADGLDQLNRARGTISKGKEEVYSGLDKALESAGALAGSLAPIASPGTEGTQAAGTAAGDGKEAAQDQQEREPAPQKEKASTPYVRQPASPEMSDPSYQTKQDDHEENTQQPDKSDKEESKRQPDASFYSFTGHLATAKQALWETNELLGEMNETILSLRPEVEETQRILKNIQKDLAQLKTSSEDLNRISDQLGKDLRELENSLRRLDDALDSTHSISYVTSPTGAISSQVQSAVVQWRTYNQATNQNLSFYDFLVNVGGKSPSEASLIVKAANGELKDGLDAADGVFDDINDKIEEVNDLVKTVSRPAARTIGDLADLTTALRQLTDLLKDLSDGETIQPVENLEDAAEMALRLCETAKDALDQVESLHEIIDTYDPHIQQALSDTQVTVTAAADTISTLTAAVRAAEELLRQSGTSLDKGTQQALAGLAEALRKSTTGLDQTDIIRNAKETLDALITDEWDSHAGGDNNVLLMDASARPVSLTDSRNQQVTSIQYVMRSQEIKVEDEEDEAEQLANKGDGGTIWSRILDMFRDFWRMITRLFGGGDSAPAQTA